MSVKTEISAALKTADAATLERVLRVLQGPETGQAITTAKEAAALFSELLGLREERFMAVALNTRNRVLAKTTLSTGTKEFTIVDPHQLYRWALTQGRSGASAVVVAHNHPTGDSTPSQQDLDVTHRLATAGRALRITLLDHLIITDRGFLSFAEQGLILPRVPDYKVVTG